ncbi:MAG: response regulator, partial [Dehalococcoidia bacterium]|nr:response regulator [Dehalococcoidia bacterium]
MEELPLKVLLLEDDEDDAFLLQSMLAKTKSPKVTLVRASRVAQALELLAGEPFDAALLDLSVPDSDGLETFARVHSAAPDLPVVLLTGLDDEALALRAVQEGAQDYLVKGQVNASLLLRSLRYAIERQRTTYYRALLTERERCFAAVSEMSDGLVVLSLI